MYDELLKYATAEGIEFLRYGIRVRHPTAALSRWLAKSLLPGGKTEVSESNKRKTNKQTKQFCD